MSEWSTITFRDAADLKKGISYTSSDYQSEDEGSPFITIKSFIKGGGYNPTGLKFIRKDLVNGNAVREGDVVFAATDLTRAGDIVGSPLKIPSFGGIQAAASMDCMVILPKTEICDRDFLYYRMMLSDVRMRMVAFSAGSTVLHLDTKQVPRIRFAIPQKVATQQKVARILQTVDRAMEKTEALIEKYQQVKAGLMHDLFTRGLWTQEELDRGDHQGTPVEATAKVGRLRPTREEAPQLYQETTIGWIPGAWKLRPAGEFISRIDAGKSPECPDRPAAPDQWGVLKVSAVGRDVFRPIENKVVEQLELCRTELLINAGDLLITRSNTPALVGMVCRVDVDYGKLMLSDKTLRLVLIKDSSVGSFVLWALRTPLSRKQIEIEATGSSSTMKNISQNNIQSILIGVPTSPIERKEIAARLDTAQQKGTREQEHLAKLETIKSGLMHDLLTGKVPITPDHEEASDV